MSETNQPKDAIEGLSSLIIGPVAVTRLLPRDKDRVITLEIRDRLATLIKGKTSPENKDKTSPENGVIHVSTNAYNGSTVKASQDQITQFVADTAYWFARYYKFDDYYANKIKVAAMHDDHLKSTVNSAVQEFRELAGRNASTNELSAFLQYHALRIQAELVRIAAQVVKNVHVSTKPLDMLVEQAKNREKLPFSVRYSQLVEVFEEYKKCLNDGDCAFREDRIKLREQYFSALDEYALVRSEALDELTRERNLIGIKPSDGLFFALYALYTKILVQARTGRLKPEDLHDLDRHPEFEQVHAAVAKAMSRHIMKAVHIPTGLTMDKYLARKSVNQDKLRKDVELAISAASDVIARKMYELAVNAAQSNSATELKAFVDAVYLDQLAHVLVFYGVPNMGQAHRAREQNQSGQHRNAAIGLGRYASYAPVVPERAPQSISSPDKLKDEIKRLYQQVVDPLEYVEGEPRYYDKLLDVIDYFYRRFHVLSKFMASFMRSPMLTGETTATVLVDGKPLQVSYRYTALDFLEFVTVRLLVKDEESRKKLVEGFISLMDELMTTDESGNVVSVKSYVESKGIRWEEFKKTLRRGLLDSVESYARFVSEGSGSALAKHIHFREASKRLGEFFNYWLLRLSREFGVLMYEYYAEMKFTGELTSIRSRVGHGAVNTTKYMRSTLRLRATVRDLAHECSELLRSSGFGKDVEGFSIKDRSKLWLGERIRVIGRWWTEVVQTRDKFERERAEALLKDLQVRAVRRFELEVPALLPDSVYEKLRTVERNFLDKMITAVGAQTGSKDKKSDGEPADEVTA